MTDQPTAFAVAGHTYRCQWRGLIWLIGAWPHARAACNTGDDGGMQQWRTRNYNVGAGTRQVRGVLEGLFWAWLVRV